MILFWSHMSSGPQPAPGLQGRAHDRDGGRFPGGKIDIPADAEVEKATSTETPFVPDNVLTFSKVDAVFKSGNATREGGSGPKYRLM